MSEGRLRRGPLSLGEKITLGLFVGLLGFLAFQSLGGDEAESGAEARAVFGEVERVEPESERVVAAAEFAKWPFTVDAGLLACRKGLLITFTSDGVEYGVNGTAKDAGYPPVDPLWALDENLGHGLKVNISEVMEAGHALC
ncbi:DUF2511 domain-containing protein [Streptomyces sp. NPDC005953]|uniref:DUF2511 domain-containing protein n=1 Tax=Streptomyces sp. NPDC005953 TaxID=3156719 RepID=UPI0033FA59D1